jgi:AraC-like DNA-binding protein
MERTRPGSCPEIRPPDLVRHYAPADNVLVWRTRPDLCGLVLWGRPTLAELGRLLAAFDVGARDGAAGPCDLLLDASRLDGLDLDLYEKLERLAASRAGDIRRRVRRQAVVRSPGLLGAAVSGFCAAIGLELSCRVFTGLAPALSWLDEPRPEALSARLDGLVAEVVSGSPLVDRLRAFLAARGRPLATIEQASRALGVSTRSLQRHLHELGTSFRRETHRSRLELSKGLLLDGELKIAAVAHRVGFSTEANFIASFRRKMGVPPAEWRRRRRDGAAVAGLESWR